jgi:hypothetical protein
MIRNLKLVALKDLASFEVEVPEAVRKHIALIQSVAASANLGGRFLSLGEMLGINEAAFQIEEWLREQSLEHSNRALGSETGARHGFRHHQRRAMFRREIGVIMGAQFSDLANEVHSMTDAVNAALTVFQGIQDSLKSIQAAPTSADIQALIDELESDKQALANGIVANTPEAPAAASPSSTGTSSSAAQPAQTAAPATADPNASAASAATATPSASATPAAA